MNKIGQNDLVRQLKHEFPALVEELDGETWVGLLHLQVACFARHTQQQIDDGNKGELCRCFEFARQFFLYGDDEVKNAMYVSYLENLNFADGRTQRRWAKELMPKPLAEGYKEIHEYLDNLGKGNDA